MRGLEQKVAIVTGAASGLGRGMAERLSAEGARVAVLDRDAEGAAATVGALSGEGLAVTVDITDYAACEAAVQQVVDTFGAVHVLVNNAGWDRAAPFMDTQPDLWRQIIDINLYGMLHMHHVTVPHLRAAGGGKIVNIASDAGRVGSSGEGVYSACKGGIIAFSKTLSRELARDGIIINTVCPGPSDTPLFASFAEGEAGARLRESLARAIPLRRLGTPEDVAGLVAFLASDDADFIVGQTISASGGLTMHG